MTLEEYMDKLQTDKDWCPGWEAITDAFDSRYGKNGLYIPHTQISDEASPLEGFGIYHAEDCFHVVTRGLTVIRANVDAFCNRVSGWGFELTLKWPESQGDFLMQSLWLLERMAQRVNTCKRGIRPMSWQELGAVTPLALQYDGAFGGLFFAMDPDMPPIQTVHGSVEFRRMVNLTEAEVEELKETPSLLAQLAFHMKQRNAHLLMQPQRRENYLPCTDKGLSRKRLAEND